MARSFRLSPLLTRLFFRAKAKPHEVKIGPVVVGTLEPREMKTGSLGWFMQGKERWKIGDATVHVQINVTMTVIGSKGLPRDEELAPLTA